MQKYDNRINLNWLEKILEWIRLKREISKLRLSIWSKESRVGKSLLRYKHLGIPTLKLNLEVKIKELGKLGKGEHYHITKQGKVIINKEPRKVRSDKGKPRGKYKTLEESMDRFERLLNDIKKSK